jgi:hypothetical protein
MLKGRKWKASSYQDLLLCHSKSTAFSRQPVCPGGHSQAVLCYLPQKLTLLTSTPVSRGPNVMDVHTVYVSIVLVKMGSLVCKRYPDNEPTWRGGSSAGKGVHDRYSLQRRGSHAFSLSICRRSISTYQITKYSARGQDLPRSTADRLGSLGKHHRGRHLTTLRNKTLCIAAADSATLRPAMRQGLVRGFSSRNSNSNQQVHSLLCVELYFFYLMASRRWLLQPYKSSTFSHRH